MRKPSDALSSGAEAPLIISPEEMTSIMPPPSAEDDELKALRMVLEGTAARVGEEFLKSLVQHLATMIDAQYAFVTEFLPEISSVRTLAFWAKGKIVDNIQWELSGTPCEDVIHGNLCHYPRHVADLFPRDVPLKEMGIESFLGVPLRDSTGKTLGHLAVFDERPMPTQPRLLYTFRIFAARAVAELQRLRMEKMLRDSEQRFRDLYEEAPIAYVHEDLESRFVTANRKAITLLGLKPEEVPGFVGISLVPNKPDAKRRVEEAFKSIGKGTDTSGVVLELTRKDDGRPIWVQWWSKPEPDGKHTRTMIVDITELVQIKEEKARIEAQNLYLQEEIKSVHNFEEIIGQSPSLVAALENVRRVAPTDASVLITGETGTGKELIARAIHSNSSRSDKPLIKINCAALPTGLVESELFGHERGAFSGAISRRIGRFELAHGGTIFLDEVGEVPLDVQVKLLRVLQEREIERVGGNTPIKADVRVIAATNRDLQKAMREGIFRQDFFYRLNVFPVQVPPLRERKQDIPLLVKFLIHRYSMQVGKRIEGVSQETMQRLMQYNWPGNVRELENVIERAVILNSTEFLEIAPELLPSIAPTNAESTPVTTPLPRLTGSLKDIEREHILAALQSSNWVIEGDHGAAKSLNMHPNTLRSRIKKMGLTRPTHEIS